MKTLGDIERPNILIDNIEKGWWNRGRTFTSNQCRELWCYIEEIEDELLQARQCIAIQKGIEPLSIHAEPDEIQEKLYNDIDLGHLGM